jgi:replicative superfamily II helicase
MDRVPERPPADGSGAFRAEIVAGLQRVDGRTDGLAEAVSRGVAFHHAGEACKGVMYICLWFSLGIERN